MSVAFKIIFIFINFRFICSISVSQSTLHEAYKFLSCINTTGRPTFILCHCVILLILFSIKWILVNSLGFSLIDFPLQSCFSWTIFYRISIITRVYPFRLPLYINTLISFLQMNMTLILVDSCSLQGISILYSLIY